MFKSGLLKWSGAALAIMLLGLLQAAPAFAANGSVAYAYDALGRISTASYDTGVCVIYNYDAAGNRTAQTVKVGTTGATGYWGCFNWNAANWGT